MILTFIGEYVWVISILLGLTLIGAFVIEPLKASINYPILAAPIAGLLVLALGTSVLYTLFGLTLFNSAAIIAIICSCITLLMLFFFGQKFKKPSFFVIIFIAIIIAFITFVNDYTTIKLKSSGAISFIPGYLGDAVFYSMLTDWLSTHVASSSLTQVISDSPYQVWVDQFLQREIRSGIFFLLAIISGLHNQSALFSYDFACAIILSAAYLGVSAVFSRSAITFFLVFFGLLVSCWFDYGRVGFFGKILGYPAALFIMGLCLNKQNPLTLTKMTCLAVLTCAASCVYPGQGIAAIFLIVGIPFLIVRALNLKALYINRDSLLPVWNDFILLFLLSMIAIATTGVISKSISLFSMPRPHIDYLTMILQIFNFQFDNFSGIRASYQLKLMLFLLFFSLSWLVIVSTIKKDKKALSLMFGPIVISSFFVFLIYIGKNDSPLFQLIGIIYPLCLLGAAQLIDSMKFEKWRMENSFVYHASLIAIMVMIIIHLPRFTAAIKIFASNEISHYHQYSKEDFDTLQKMIGKSSIMMDMSTPSPEACGKPFDCRFYFVMPIFVEFERRKIAIQWTPQSWDKLLSWIGSSLVPSTPPKIDKISHLRMTLADDLQNKNCVTQYKTSQYKLLDCKESFI